MHGGPLTAFPAALFSSMCGAHLWRLLLRGLLVTFTRIVGELASIPIMFCAVCLYVFRQPKDSMSLLLWEMPWGWFHATTAAVIEVLFNVAAWPWAATRLAVDAAAGACARPAAPPGAWWPRRAAGAVLRACLKCMPHWLCVAVSWAVSLASWVLAAAFYWKALIPFAMRKVWPAWWRFQRGAAWLLWWLPSRVIGWAGAALRYLAAERRPVPAKAWDAELPLRDRDIKPTRPVHTPPPPEDHPSPHVQPKPKPRYYRRPSSPLATSPPCTSRVDWARGWHHVAAQAGTFATLAGAPLCGLLPPGKPLAAPSQAAPSHPPPPASGAAAPASPSPVGLIIEQQAPAGYSVAQLTNLLVLVVQVSGPVGCAAPALGELQAAPECRIGVALLW